MTFTETKLRGAFTIAMDENADFRGHFARTFCADEFMENGLNPRVAQCSVSFNKRQGTLRGMHWQDAPFAEAKLIRVTRGVIHDVIADLRPGSPTRFQYVSVELSAENGRMLYVPEGFAHGFQTLADDTEVHYQMSEVFAPDLARGARWSDPALDIAWPLPNPIVSERDRAWPDLLT